MKTLQEDLIENYDKFPAKHFAETYGKTLSVIYSLASKLNLGRGPRRTGVLKDEILKEYYVNGLTIKQIYEKFKIGKCTIGKILEKYGTCGRTPENYENHKYSCDETFFETIDSPEKAYWFGFIAADGNLYNKKLQICLADKDENHLLKFCKRINYNGPLYNDSKAKRLTISRIKIYNDLIGLGMELDKTFKINENIFNFVPEHLVPAAMHGYFDGDGSFSKSNNNLQFFLLGNESFLNMFGDRLKSFGFYLKGPVKDKRTRQTFKSWEHLNPERAEIIKKLFYENEHSSKDFLDRKKQKLYDKFI